jgi:hypothetical protein
VLEGKARILAFMTERALSGQPRLSIAGMPLAGIRRYAELIREGPGNEKERGMPAFLQVNSAAAHLFAVDLPADIRERAVAPVEPARGRAIGSCSLAKPRRFSAPIRRPDVPMCHYGRFFHYSLQSTVPSLLPPVIYVRQKRQTAQKQPA